MHVNRLNWDHNKGTMAVSPGNKRPTTKRFTQQLLFKSFVEKLLPQFSAGAHLILKDIWRVKIQSWDDEFQKHS